MQKIAQALPVGESEDKCRKAAVGVAQSLATSTSALKAATEDPGHAEGSSLDQLLAEQP